MDETHGGSLEASLASAASRQMVETLSPGDTKKKVAHGVTTRIGDGNKTQACSSINNVPPHGLARQVALVIKGGGEGLAR